MDSHESEHEANLFNNSITHDYIKEKSKNLHDSQEIPKPTLGEKDIMEDIMKQVISGNLKHTETDMMFEGMANSEKLVSKDKIKTFEKPLYPQTNYNAPYKEKNDVYEDDKNNRKFQSSDDINDYIKESEKEKPSTYNPYGGNYPTHMPTPAADRYGPSYGSGVSIPSNPQPDHDPYYGFKNQKELDLAKLDMIRKLGELTQHGVVLSQKFNMNSDYQVMQYEYDLHKNIRDKHNGVKWMSNLMLNLCWGIELGNEYFNPFEFKLKGWSEQMNEDIPEYYDVLGELYEKYFKAGKPIPPELKLALLMGGSALKFHFAHTQLGKIPSLSEALLQNPGLAQKLNEQAVSDKVKDQFERQREVFQKKSLEEHEKTKKKLDDLQILNNKKIDHEHDLLQQQAIQNQNMQQQFMQQQMMQQQLMHHQLIEKQKQLEQLQAQLNLQRSDTRSMYTNNTQSKKNNSKKTSNNSVNSNKKQETMTTPYIPASLKNKFSLINKNQKNTNNSNQTNNGNQKLENKFQNHQMFDDNASIDPDIDNLIDQGFNDSKSRISNDSRSVVSSRSSKSRISNKSSNSRNKKKSTIKINT